MLRSCLTSTLQLTLVIQSPWTEEGFSASWDKLEIDVCYELLDLQRTFFSSFILAVAHPHLRMGHKNLTQEQKA